MWKPQRLPNVNNSNWESQLCLQCETKRKWKWPFKYNRCPGSFNFSWRAMACVWKLSGIAKASPSVVSGRETLIRRLIPGGFRGVLWVGLCVPKRHNWGIWFCISWSWRRAFRSGLTNRKFHTTWNRCLSTTWIHLTWQILETAAHSQTHKSMVRMVDEVNRRNLLGVENTPQTY